MFAIPSRYNDKIAYEVSVKHCFNAIFSYERSSKYIAIMRNVGLFNCVVYITAVDNGSIIVNIIQECMKQKKRVTYFVK